MKLIPGTTFPKLHDVYVGRVLLGMVLLSWAVLVGLDFIIGGLMPEIGDIGDGDYTFSSALVYVIYTVPRRAYFLFPTAAVIGTLMGLGQLATTSELTALRALGLSRRRLGLAVAMTLAVLTALMVVNGETLAPWGQRRADALKASARSPDMIVAQYSGCGRARATPSSMRARARSAATARRAGSSCAKCTCTNSTMPGAWSRSRAPNAPSTATAAGCCTTCGGRGSRRAR